MTEIHVDRDAWTNQIQLSIWNGDNGYRIAGPKFNGFSQELLTHTLSDRDKEEIIAALGLKVFN